MFIAFHAHLLCTTIIHLQGRSLDTVQLLPGSLLFTSTSISIMSSNIFCASSWKNCNVGMISPCSKWTWKMFVCLIYYKDLSKFYNCPNVVAHVVFVEIGMWQCFKIVNFMEMFEMWSKWLPVTNLLCIFLAIILPI